MHLACIQPDIAWEDPAANRAAIRAMLDFQPQPAGSLVVLPEMFSTGFSMNVARTAEPEPSETARFLADTARERSHYIVAGMVTRSADGRGKNIALAFDPSGREIARYTKLHPFSFAGENDHFEPGDRLVSFPWQDIKVVPFICYDLRFPEIFRASASAHLFVVIANWPAAREDHWLTLLRARAIENQAYVAGVNRCGTDPKNSYNGRTQIIGPRGEIVADAGSAPGIIEATLDLPALEKYRAEFPALRDRRRDLA